MGYENRIYIDQDALRAMEKYKEIHELFEYCEEIGIDATLEQLFDGFTIRFPNGGDFVQHGGSYGSHNGCVEPAIGSQFDYTAVHLDKAKTLVKYHKERLNNGA